MNGTMSFGVTFKEVCDNVLKKWLVYSKASGSAREYSMYIGNANPTKAATNFARCSVGMVRHAYFCSISAARSLVSASWSPNKAIAKPLMLFTFIVVINSAASAATSSSAPAFPPKRSHHELLLNHPVSWWTDSAATPTKTPANEIYSAISHQDISDIRELRELSAAMRHFSAIQNLIANALAFLAILGLGSLGWRWFGSRHGGR